jgi:C1A family cysteine protease
METKYKLNYSFQIISEKDYTLKAENHPNDNNLEITTSKIPKINSSTTKVTKSSPSFFKISTIGIILDQGDIGSCVSCAFAFSVNTQTTNHFSLSRLFHYAICRIIQYSSLDQDDGTTIRTGCKSISNYGAIPENTYSYNTRSFSQFPSLSIIKSAKYFKKFTYTFINQDLTSIKNCLNTYKAPIIFGFLVYSSFFNTGSNGIVASPNTSSETLEGGHCMNIIGYDDSKSWFICVNSWGKSFGNNGICYMPYSYMLNSKLASDFCFTQFIY